MINLNFDISFLNARILILNLSTVIVVIFCGQTRLVTGQNNNYIWNTPQATIIGTGDLKWKPEPFKYNPGSSIRYIDYENGDDTNDGLSTATPWKHHPWDTQSTGNASSCNGVHTYVFKRGVIYRGELVSKESGNITESIQLTSDPKWGDGEAMIYGSVRITEGWIRCDSLTAPNISEPEKVYYIDMPLGTPETKYVAEIKDGDLYPIHLARVPNYNITDSLNPMKNWWKWTGVYNNATHKKGGYMIDEKNLTQSDANYWKGGTVWSEWDGTMGTVWNMTIKSYDPLKHSITTNNEYTYGGEGKRYYIENLPQLLDAPMEFWLSKQNGLTKRLFVRLSGERDPNSTIIELATTERIIKLINTRHISISGLTFAFNTSNKYHFQDGNAKDIASVINLSEFCYNIEIKNCKFKYVNSGISVENSSYSSQNVHHITITDNYFERIGDQAITFGNQNGKYMEDIYILRNNVYESGFRQLNRWYSAIPAINGYFKTAVVAGNFVNYSWGSGLYLHWGKPDGDATRDINYINGMVFQNRVENTLLGTSDWGGIEHWQGGPAFYFNNYSKNAHGWKGSSNNVEWNPWGFPFYLDGSFKVYLFNNIAVSPFNSLTDPSKRNRAGYQMVLGMYNILANNTSHNFYMGITTHEHSGGTPCYNRYLGNVLNKTSHIYYKTNDSGSKTKYDSFVNNIFSGSANTYWKYKGGVLRSFFQFQNRLENLGAQNSQLGWEARSEVFINPSENNFLPLKNGEAIDRGVRFFAPFPLSQVVGEWHFYEHIADNSIVIGENFYMTSEYANREDFDKVLKNNLEVLNYSDTSYVYGKLEDWTKGALVFDGISTFCKVNDHSAQQQLKCNDLDVGNKNFIIETYLKTENGNASTIISKYGESTNGYALKIDENGKAAMCLLVNGNEAVSVAGSKKINDSNWHHILAEITRNSEIKLYIDGELDKGVAIGNMPSQNESLTNDADFLVGKSLSDDFFKGSIDFIRISKGNLSEANTNIEELYKWQFDGPHLYDFTGNAPIGKRDAGALENGGIPTTAENFKSTIHQSKFNVFPNPARQQIEIYHSFKNPVKVRVFDAFGRVLLEKRNIKNEQQLDVSELSPGIYFIQASYRKSEFSQKLVIH